MPPTRAMTGVAAALPADGARIGRWLRAMRQQANSGPGQRPPRHPGGLTQVEVARLAGITARAYQLIESGTRPPGMRALDGITRALKLDQANRLHLECLAGLHPPPTPPSLPGSALRQLLNAVASPCLAIDEAWTVTAANPAAAANAPDLAHPGANCLQWFFSPHARTLISDWQAEAEHLIACVRRVHGQYPNAQRIDAVMATLTADSSSAAHLWSNEGPVACDRAQHTYLLNPAAYRAIGAATVYTLHPGPVATPAQRLLLLVPEPSG